MSTRSALCLYDFTLSVRKTTDDHLVLIKELKEIAKKWVFQMEKAPDNNLDEYSSNEEYTSDSDISTLEGFTDEEESENSNEEYDTPTNDNDKYDLTADLSEDDYCYDDVEEENTESDSEYSSSEDEDDGYVHWQGRISLFKRKRLCELKALCKANELLLSKAHFSPTSNPGLGSVFYCCKLDTRIAGPWSDQDPELIPMPRQLKHISSLYSWQQEIIDRSIYCWDSRKINVLYDPTGCSGKSTLVTWCKVHNILNCKTVPCILNSFLDLNQAVMSQPVGQLYYVDMPRALPKNKLNDFMAFIETLKNGYCYDTRYKYTERFFDSPVVWIFCNIKLPTEMLSRDRWRIYNINDEKELVLYPSGEKDEEIIYPEVDFSEEPIDYGSPEEEDEEIFSSDEKELNLEDMCEIEEFKINQLIKIDENVIRNCVTEPEETVPSGNSLSSTS